MSIGIIVIVVCLFLFACSVSHNRIVVSVLAFLIFEGAFRKWVLPQASDFIYFVKDFLLLIVYFKYFIVKERKIFPHIVNYLIYLLAIWTLVQAFNPNLGSFYVGLLGIKSYLIYIPLFWVSRDLFGTKEDIYKFIRNYLLIIIPVCFLAIIQFFSSPSSPINTYAATSNVATFGASTEQIVRVTGTFPYITGFGTYLCANFSLLLPLLESKQSNLWRNIFLLELILILGTSFMTGSRAVVFYIAIFTICYIALSNKISISFHVLKRIILPIIIGLGSLPFFFGKGISTFYERSASNSDEFYSRIFEPVTQSLTVIRQLVKLKLIDSYGTGATNQAAPVIRKLFDLPSGGYVPPAEIESTRVAIEIGIIGFVLWFTIRFMLIIFLWKTVSKVENLFFKKLAISAFLFHTIQLTVPVIFNPTMAIYYWFFAAFTFLLPKLDNSIVKIT